MGYISITSDGAFTYSEGYEDTGAQQADAPAQEALSEDSLYAAIMNINTALVNEARGQELDHAIAALHRQHTYNGRPSLYLPEAE